MIRTLALLVLPVALAACALTRGAESPVTLRLSPGFAEAGPKRAAPSIAIAPVQARGLAGALRYGYVDPATPGEIRQAATLFWEEPPPRAIERALVEGLRSRFAAVTGPAGGIPADRSVIATLDRFEELSGARAHAVVALDVTVIALPERRLALAGRYCGEAPVEGSSGSARARAFSAAIGTAIVKLADDLASGSDAGAGCAD